MVILRNLVTFVGFFLIFPLGAEAAVVINEIAWMGTVSSANDEWLELYNDGTEEVSLDGWIIVSQGGTPFIGFT